jgi:HAD superfamily hydrolase (TIGR01549 family)
MIICFDLDGTLLDTEDWILNAQIKALKQNGIKQTKEQIYKFWGLTLADQIKKINPKVKKVEIEKINKDFNKIRFSNTSKVKPYKNTKRILKQLSKEYSLCLLSNNSHSSIIKALKSSKIDKNIFETIVGSNEVEHPKPFPDEIYKAEKRLKKKVKYMVGDTNADIKTAKKAKVKSIIILNAPKQTWKDLKKADFKIKDIKELPNLIKEVN